MKKTKTIYWIFTGLLAALMIASSIPDILCVPDAVALVCTHLGYPLYFLPLVGVAKLLGAAGIVIPGYPRIKEWAYAGLAFDLTSAVYSSIAVHDSPSQWMPLLILPALVMCSYFFYHKLLREQKQSA